MKTQTSLLTLCSALLFSGLAVAESPPQNPATMTAVAPDAATPAATTPVPASPPTADQSTTPPAPSTSDIKARRGFLLRLQLGGGYRSISSGDGSTAIDISGTGFGGSLQMGGAILENVFLYGEVLADYTSDPTIEVGQVKAVAKNASTRLLAFGPGIAYLMPQGIHIGGSLLMARMTINQDDQELASTDMGYGLAARVGKDFWLGEHQALGVVGQFTLATMPDKSTSSAAPPNFTSTGFTLALSGTYN